MFAGHQPREPAHVDGGAVEDLRDVRLRRLEFDARLGQACAVRGDAARQAPAAGERAAGGAGRGERAGLEDAADPLREALRPAARERRIVVHVDEGAEHDGRVFPDRVDQHEGLAVLVARRVQQLVVLGGELPVEEQQGGMSVGLRIGRQARRQQRFGGLRVGLVLDADDVAGVVPGRRRRSGGEAQRRAGSEVTLEHVCSPRDAAVQALRALDAKSSRTFRSLMEHDIEKR